MHFVYLVTGMKPRNRSPEWNLGLRSSRERSGDSLNDRDGAASTRMHKSPEEGVESDGLPVGRSNLPREQRQARGLTKEPPESPQHHQKQSKKERKNENEKEGSGSTQACRGSSTRTPCEAEKGNGQGGITYKRADSGCKQGQWRGDTTSASCTKRREKVLTLLVCRRRKEQDEWTCWTAGGGNSSSAFTTEDLSMNASWPGG